MTNNKTILTFYVVAFNTLCLMNFFLDIGSKHPYNWDQQQRCLKIVEK